MRAIEQLLLSAVCCLLPAAAASCACIIVHTLLCVQGHWRLGASAPNKWTLTYARPQRGDGGGNPIIIIIIDIVRV